MGDVSSTDKRQVGCGLFNAVFRKSKLRSRRSASTSSLPVKEDSGNNPTDHPKRRRNSFHDGAFLDQSSDSNDSSLRRNRAPNPCQQMPKPQQQTRIIKPKNNANEKSIVVEKNKGFIGISGELEAMIADHQKSRGGNSNLVRASSGNVMLYGHLGNLKQPSSSNSDHNSRVKSQAQMVNAAIDKKYANSVMGNIVRKDSNNAIKQDSNNPVLCRALSCRMDPEQLKIMGNEDYKNGRFAEAVTLYERAIDIDPSKASYRSNKSAALAALGRLLEAVFECREAIKIEPQYHRAHHRLANLYLRLGEAEKALYHFKQAGPEADPDAMARAKVVLAHLKKCDQAK